MAKKKRKDKELAHLRREVEVLRAQLAGQKPVEAPKKPEPVETAKTTKEPEMAKTPKIQPTVSTRGGPAFGRQSVDPKYIKADLLKSGILTFVALGAIVALTIIL